MSSREWDAASYHRVSEPQLAWAREQLERLELTGEETVLDAGCGSGRVTAELLKLVPRGRVYAVDASQAMVDHARQILDGRATVLCQDLVELELPAPVDAVFSNATFHWIHDHDALFAALARNMKPGAQLVAQCGGLGNVDSFRRTADEVRLQEPFAPYFRNWERPWNYADAPESAERLGRAGFEQIRCWLEPRPTTLTDARAFVSTVCLVRHLDPLPSELHEPFVDRVLAELDHSRGAHAGQPGADHPGEPGGRADAKRRGEPLVLDYVRLNLTGRRT
jgi:trans-aconitate 2-methyltransferase